MDLLDRRALITAASVTFLGVQPIALLLIEATNAYLSVEVGKGLRDAHKQCLHCVAKIPHKRRTLPNRRLRGDGLCTVLPNYGLLQPLKHE